MIKEGCDQSSKVDTSESTCNKCNYVGQGLGTSMHKVFFGILVRRRSRYYGEMVESMAAASINFKGHLSIQFWLRLLLSLGHFAPYLLTF